MNSKLRPSKPLPLKTLQELAVLSQSLQDISQNKQSLSKISQHSQDQVCGKQSNLTSVV